MNLLILLKPLACACRFVRRPLFLLFCACVVCIVELTKPFLCLFIVICRHNTLHSGRADVGMDGMPVSRICVRKAVEKSVSTAYNMLNKTAGR